MSTMNAENLQCGPPNVGGCPSEILDVTHCFWVMCPHPWCWEAEQRVARGVARCIQSRTPVRSMALLQDDFPTLNIVNVSEWAKTRKIPKKNMLCREVSSQSCHSVSSQPQLCSQSQNFLEDSNVRLESLNGLHFPQLPSAAKSLHSTNYKCNKDVKLSLAQISPIDLTCGSVSKVEWIPNPKRISHGPSHNRRKSQHIAVRELACIPSSHLYDIPKPNRENSRNVERTCTELASPNGRPGDSGHVVSRITLHTSDTDLTELRRASTIAAEAELAAGGNRTFIQPEPEPVTLIGSHPNPLYREPRACLRKKPAISPRERARRPQRDATLHAQAQLTQYKIEIAGGAEGPDWLRLRNQTYLWKKRNLRQYSDKDGPALPPPQPPHRRAGTHCLSKAPLHLHCRSAMQIGPGVYCCVECGEEMSGCGGEGSDSSAAGRLHKLSQGLDPVPHSSLRQNAGLLEGERAGAGGLPAFRVSTVRASHPA